MRTRTYEAFCSPSWELVIIVIPVEEQELYSGEHLASATGEIAAAHKELHAVRLEKRYDENLVVVSGAINERIADYLKSPSTLSELEVTICDLKLAPAGRCDLTLERNMNLCKDVLQYSLRCISSAGKRRP
jgi:hypothetical protein